MPGTVCLEPPVAEIRRLGVLSGPTPSRFGGVDWCNWGVPPVVLHGLGLLDQCRRITAHSTPN